MTTATGWTGAAGADTGAVLSAARSAELHHTMASAEASHLGTYLATRTPALPVRLVRTTMAAFRAAGAEWQRREPVVVRGSVPVGA